MSAALDTAAGADRFRIFGAPRRYVQGAGALDDLGRYAESLGRRATVLMDSRVQALFADRVGAALEAAGLPARMVVHDGEVMPAQLQPLGSGLGLERSEVVIGVGGGKVLDSAKFLAAAAAAPLVLAPTLGSSDAPTSRVIVLYDAAHRLTGLDFLRWNPDVVLVDTGVLVRAPQRYFVSGIGDAIAKMFEAEASARWSLPSFFAARPSLAARCLAEESYAVIRRHGAAAVAAVAAQRPDPAFEDVVEATVLLSGLSFENGGLFLAHSMTRGFAMLPQTQACLHGELVAFGLLVQLMQERRPTPLLAELLDFYARIGLPNCLAAIGLDAVDDAGLHSLAAATLEAPYMRCLTGQLAAQELVALIRALDTLSLRSGHAVTEPVWRRANAAAGG